LSLVNSDITLTHWSRPDGARLEEVSMSLGRGEVCASTPSGDLTPYSQQYEGYMGNWGNTLDRWYHRAAVVVWPREQAFANRAEASPAWALDELTAMTTAGRLPDARAAAATLAPFWKAAVRNQTSQENNIASRLFGKALRAAEALADAAIAAMLLRPFRVAHFTDTHVKPFTRMAGGYGQQWTADLLRTWFADGQPAWAYGGGRELSQWVADRLPSLCQRLHTTTGNAGTLAAQQLVDLAWEWIGKDIHSALGFSPPGYRDRQLNGLGGPLASVLTAAAAIGMASTRDKVTEYARQQDDAITVLEISALRVAAATSTDARDDTGFDVLASDCAARLSARLARPEREADDWSVELPASGCACDLCCTLRTFLSDTRRRTFEWPLAKDSRQHAHSRIDSAELPVTYATRRQGRPYTLVLEKTDDLFSREQEARVRDETDLAWLTGEWETNLHHCDTITVWL
jgi:hypothetical protein